MNILSKHKNENKYNTSNRRKSTSTYPTTASPADTTFPPTYTHNHAPTTLLESFLEASSIKLTEGTRYALSTITPSFLINTYLYPLIPYFHNLYISQPPGGIERFGMWGCLVAGALPVGCLIVGFGMACVGCIVVTGSALLFIQMSCLTVMGCMLAPAGVLTALFIGLPSLVFYGIYSSYSFLLSLFGKKAIDKHTHTHKHDSTN
ncbi:MAG: hypothetical protein JOS17DRAFT_820396 [Linnemannia elongata]|nr:MAG: hypothetical protein JOS17DRAFT_820396 [Linnemannia elongata]